MTFGSSMAPNAGAGQEGTDSNPDLVNKWMAYLSHPTVQAGLLQFAASVMQPLGIGQTPLGRVGTALGDTGAAVGRMNAEQEARQQLDIQNKQKQEAQALDARQVAATEARVKQEGLTAQQQQELERQRLAETTRSNLANEGLTAQQIAEQRVRDAAYAESLKAGSKGLTFGQQVAMKTAADVYKSSYQDAIDNGKTPDEAAAMAMAIQAHYLQQFSQSGVGGPAEGAAPLVPGTQPTKMDNGGIKLPNGNTWPPLSQIPDESLKSYWKNATEEEKQAFREMYVKVAGEDPQAVEDKINKATGANAPPKPRVNPNLQPAPQIPPLGQPDWLSNSVLNPE